MAEEQQTAPNILNASKLDLVNAGVTEFASKLREDMADEHSYIRQGVESYLSVLQAGGKRVRGALAITAYEMHGSTDTAVATSIAGIIEALHAYLLVRDDIEDRATIRRGRPTAHVAMELFLREREATGNVHQIAMDLATNGALIGQHKAQSMLADLEVAPRRLLEVIATINEHLEYTGAGQMLDLALTTGILVSIKDIITVALSKTAYYTFQMPLETGAILAGATEQQLKLLKKYALHAGVAFQLQDDVMGTFGDEQKMGKPVKSDFMEGKQTLLLAYAINAADSEQLAILQHALGNPELSDEDFARCQGVLIETGALEKVRKKAGEQARLAHKVLDDAPKAWPDTQVEYLRRIAAFTVERES